MNNEMSFIGRNRRVSSDRRVSMDPFYMGPERRSGIDARGWKEIAQIKVNNTPKVERSSYDWLHGGYSNGVISTYY